ncbi:TIGR04282 family arsenosugar biosynthesis glycosyltransferase [Mycobacterium sp. SMC-4]|uniref:TIGR04282 family arsenosugar biosynthesis glycosyltransferase n=1 Tax=Mycobacterium sp. SMC-4 TaxID=2857059 RepID=UPI003CFEE9B0
MTVLPVTTLVVAKAPVPGLAKTRLAATVGDDVAADVAAAALLDTLDAVAAASVSARVVAMTGDLRLACRSDEIGQRLSSFTVVPQRGTDFAARLVCAHADAATVAGEHPIVQIGMDTPQVTGELISDCAVALWDTEALLGMAADGGWWVLGVRSGAMAECLRPVPMSRPDTGALTLKALRDKGYEVCLVEELADVDTAADVERVRRCCHPGSRFAAATRAAGL